MGGRGEDSEEWREGDERKGGREREREGGMRGD